MKRIILIWGSLLALLLPPSVTFASHIIGGIITYDFVSRNGNTATYKFKLTLYKDCASNNGTGNNSPLPTSIRYNVFINNVRLLNTAPIVTMTSAGVVNVAPPSYPCLTIPPYVCVQKADYEWTTTLRDTNVTYFISTSICCRNERISNIFSNPNSTGASYFAEITPAAQRANNSSPSFTAFPPTVICVGEPLHFDHSAFDADGDSLTYEFCYSNNVRSLAVPSCTGSATNPCAPPFESVQYRAPQYSATNPMGGNPRIVINPATGLITGTPNVQGNYVVGVCVKEYRNGVYMGSIFRDFQFNAEICRREVVAAVSADSLGGSRFFLKSCDDSTVTIFNTSTQRANIFSTLWEFYIRDSIYRFNTWDATVAFPDTGTYRARLLLNPNTACGDSAELTVRIGAYSLAPKFNFHYDTCVAGPVSFQNLTVSNPEYPFTKFLWNFGDNDLDSTTWSPDHQFAVAGAKQVSLKLWDRLGCTKDTAVSFDWLPAPPIIIVEPSNYKGCVPGRISFKNRSHPVDSTYDVRWSFGDGGRLNGVDAQHVYEQAGTFTITVEVTSPIGCKKSAVFKDLIQVYPNPKANFDFTPKQPTNLLPTVNFWDSSSTDVVARRWFFGGTYGSSVEKNPQVIYGRDTGWVEVKLLVNNQYGCADTVMKRIFIKPEVAFYMPNAFTPNQDALNEDFKGVGFIYGLKAFRMAIWSRWGELVFETTDPNQGWNGSKFNNGTALPEGVYLYEVDYITPTGEKVSKKDYFTLFR